MGESTCFHLLIFNVFRAGTLLQLDFRLFTSACFTMGYNVTCFCKGNLCEIGANKLVNENREEGNALNKYTDITAKFKCLACHTKSNTCLGEEGNTQIFNYVIIAFCCLCAKTSTKILTNTAKDDIRSAYYNINPVFENG